MSELPRWERWLLALVLLPALPLLLQSAVVIQHDVWISDLWHSQLPYKAVIGEQLRSGGLPLWMPQVFSGVPLLAQIEAGALYLPHWPLFALLPPVVALNLALVLDLVVGGLGAAALARRAGARPAAAVLAALAFAWSGFFVTHIRHLNMHAAAAWLPWMVLFAERVLHSRGRQGGATLALATGLQVLAGHPQITYLSLLLLGARGLAHLPGEERRDRLAGFAWMIAATGVGGLLAMVQLLPTLLFTAESLARSPPTWDYASAYPYTWTDLWTFVRPAAAGAMESFDYRGGGETIPWGNYGYMGLLPLLLAPLGLRGRLGRFWGLAALASLILVLGPLTPVYRVAWELLPGMKLFRFPTRFLLPLALGIALLAALGAQRLADRVGPRALPLLVLMALATTADLWWTHRPRLPLDDPAPWAAPSPIAEVAPPELRVHTLQEFELWERAFVAARGHTLGPDPYRRAWQLPLGSSGALSGLSASSGYARMVHHRCAAFWQGYNTAILAERFPTRQPRPESPELPDSFRSLLARASVGTLVSPFPLRDPALRLLASDPLPTYAVEDALPRALVVHRWQPVSSLKEAADWMLRDGVAEPAVPAIEDAPASPEQGPPARAAELLELRPHHLRITLPQDLEPGWLVLSDTWDSGWSAWVDGEPAGVAVANGYQRAVALPAGARQVELRYWPAGLSIGLALSVLGAGLLALLGLRGRRTTKTGRRLSSS